MKSTPLDFLVSLCVAVAALSPQVHAQSQAQPAGTLPAQNIVITGQRAEVEAKPYADLLKAVSMFEPYRAAHPDAQLRFRLWPRKAEPDMTDLSLYVFDPESHTRTEIALAADFSFVLPMVPPSQQKSSIVRANRSLGTLVWTAQITRGPDQLKRRVLGDLRMECKVDLEAGNLARGVSSPAVLVIRAGGDPCGSKGIWYVHYGEQPLFAVHLKYKDRVRSLFFDQMYGGSTPSLLHPLLDWPYLLKDQSYRSPGYDPTWPDESEVELVYVTDQSKTAGAK